MVRAKSYKAATQLFTQALEHGEKSWYYHKRGCAYRQLGDAEAALADDNRALSLALQDVSAPFSRLWLCKDRCVYNKAPADGDLAITLAPYDPSAIRSVYISRYAK